MLDLIRKAFRLRAPHPALAENRERFARFDQTGPLEQYGFTVFDTELTGLNRRRDEIISIGAVRIEQLRIVPARHFHCLVRPGRIRPNKATLVHRITPEALEKARPVEEALPEFIAFCGDSLLVGHFVDIDLHFLNKAARRTLGGTLSNPSIDTMRLARRYREAGARDFYGQHDLSHAYTLDALAEEFSLPRFSPHDALEDALQTAYLFVYLVRKFQRGGISTLKELYSGGRFQGLKA